MKSLATFVCLLLVFGCYEGRKSTSYPCNIYGNGLTAGSSGLEVDSIATGCPNGVINWSYPRGRLLLTFPYPGNGVTVRTRVCLSTRSSIGTITAITSQQVLTKTGGRYCTPFRVGYYAIIEFTPAAGFMYRAVIDYNIEQQQL